MKNRTENIASELKKLIDVKGPEYIYNEPFETYRYLSESSITDKRIFAAILYVLVSGIPWGSEERSDSAKLSKIIQNECCFNYQMANQLAEIFSILYSPENEMEWEAKKLSGLEEFLGNEFICDWEGFAVWRTTNGSVSCHYNANIELYPEDKEIILKELATLTEGNPFVTREEICKYYSVKLANYLNEIFEDYCTCEPLYEPVVEDFFVEEYAEEWCLKNGIKIVSCDGGGYDDGYDPDFFAGEWNY